MIRCDIRTESQRSLFSLNHPTALKVGVPLFPRYSNPPSCLGDFLYAIVHKCNPSIVGDESEPHYGGTTMGGITIELVSVGGKLVGRTASCRFNLRMLGLDDMADDGRNGASLKRARRVLSREWGGAFTLSKARAKTISLPTSAEVEALGEGLALAA